MAALALVAALFLVRLANRDRWQRLCVVVFALCMVVLYSASGLYHALRLPPDELRVYQRLDMSAIYLMVAGSCTPIAGLLLRGPFRAVLLIGVWLFAAVGIAALWAMPRPDYGILVGTYLGMGWLGMSGIWQYWRATGWRGMTWIAGGAMFYTAGAVFELANWPVLWPGVVRSHELLHFCDMAGTCCHLVFVLKYVLPYRPPIVVEDGQAAGFAIPAEA
jgi:hemolysin III